jgi:hypothetical protein
VSALPIAAAAALHSLKVVIKNNPFEMHVLHVKNPFEVIMPFVVLEYPFIKSAHLR